MKCREEAAAKKALTKRGNKIRNKVKSTDSYNKSTATYEKGGKDPSVTITIEGPTNLQPVVTPLFEGVPIPAEDQLDESGLENEAAPL